MTQPALIAAAVSTVLWIFAGTIAKKISSDLGGRTVSLIYATFSLLPILIIVYLVGDYSISAYSIFLSAAAGLFLGAGFILGFKALQTEKLASVSALAEIQPAFLVLLSIIVLNESINILQAASIAIIFAGALMIITTEKLRININLLPALLSFISWSIYWAIMVYAVTSAGTFALPIFISRLAGVPLIAIYFIYGIAANSEKGGQGLRSILSNPCLAISIILTLVASFADAVGDTIFGITIGSNVLALGAALIALQPMAVSFLGFALYRDRMTRVQLIGFIIMVAGAFSLSVL